MFNNNSHTDIGKYKNVHDIGKPKTFAKYKILHSLYYFISFDYM